MVCPAAARGSVGSSSLQLPEQWAVPGSNQRPPACKAAPRSSGLWEGAVTTPPPLLSCLSAVDERLTRADIARGLPNRPGRRAPGISGVVAPVVRGHASLDVEPARDGVLTGGAVDGDRLLPCDEAARDRLDRADVTHRTLRADRTSRTDGALYAL